MSENTIKVLSNNNFINNKLNTLLIAYMLINYNLPSYVMSFTTVFLPLMISDSPTETVGRPGTASLRPTTGYRPGSALRPSSGFRPLTASRRPATTSGGNVRPLTAEKASREESSEDKNITEDASSELTMGTVVCGNPSKALFSRRKINPGSQNTNESTGLKLFPQFLHKPEHTYDPVPDDDKERADIVAELKEWKQHHEKMMEKIKAEKAPQV